MKKVVFTYENGSQTRHNAEGISTISIAKIVGSTIGYNEQTYDSKTKEMRSKDINLRVIKAEIY